MAFSPLNTLGYSLYSNLPSPPAPRSSSSSSSLFSNFYTSSQGSAPCAEQAPAAPPAAPENTFCVFTSTPSFYSQLCDLSPQEKRSSTEQSSIVSYNSNYSTSHLPSQPHSYTPPSKSDQRLFYATRYSLFAEFLAANADYFTSKQRSLTSFCSPYRASITSTTGSVTCSSRVSSPYTETGFSHLYSDLGNWIILLRSR